MTLMRLTIGVVVAGLVLAATALAAPTKTAVTVTAGKPSELRFTLSKKTVPAGAVTFTITNKGSEDDRLLAAASPTAAKVEVHKMEVVNDVMVMRPVEGGLEIPAGAAVELKPGGLHLMFLRVSTPFKDGSSVPCSRRYRPALTGTVALATCPP